jgi:hypothetical protein
MRLRGWDAQIVITDRIFWWMIGVVLSLVLAFAGAMLFYALLYTVGPFQIASLWPVGALPGIAVGLYISRLVKRLRTRAILPVMNGIISLIVLTQAIFWSFAFIPSDTSALFGFTLLLPLIAVSLFSFWKKLAVPIWVICHEAVNLVILIVVNFSWWYWSQSYMSQGACMTGVSPLTRIDSVYFTLTTLATVGYGDIHPASETCREIVSWQIIASSVLVVIILALLVSRIGEGAGSTIDNSELLGTVHQIQERLKDISNDLDQLKANIKLSTPDKEEPPSLRVTGKG